MILKKGGALAVFSVGELVIYGGEGVCRVERIGPSTLSCADPNREYYTLCPVFHTGEVTTPVDTRVLMRPVMTAQEAEEFLAALPAMLPEAPGELSQRAAREYYQAAVSSFDCCRMVALLKMLYAKREAARRSGKKISQLDERCSKRAEDHLYEELAAALGIEKNAVCARIRLCCPDWPEK